MELTELQAELETLCYGERVARVIDLARQPENTALFDRMEGSSAFDLRWMAALSCLGSRDGARALRLCGDPSRIIRNGAANILVYIGAPEQIGAMLEAKQPKERCGLLARLRKRGLSDVIDAYLRMPAVQGDAHLFTALLPFGSPALVRTLLPDLAERLTPANWTRMARFHPDIALETLQADAAAAEQPDAGLASRAHSVLWVTAETRPDASLTLVRALARHVPLHNLSFGTLARQLPTEVADLALEAETAPYLPLHNMLPRLDTDRALRLMERSQRMFPWGRGRGVAALLKRCPVELREPLYMRFGRAWQDADDCLSPEIVRCLPPTWRLVEGRRHVRLPALAARPAQRLLYAAFLPWEEARETLDSSLQNPDPELRAVAHAALANAVRYQRDRLSDLLALNLARKNEQDPIRLAMLTGLTDLPPSIWKPEHLDALAQVLGNALSAADLSPQTANTIGRLIARLLPFHPSWSAEWLALLAQERGSLSLPQKDLTDAQMLALAPVLLPVLQTWENREGWARLITVASAMGKRLHVFGALADMLERIAREPAAGRLSASALSLLAAHCPERLPALVPALVAADPSWVQNPNVYTFLHRKRQDLLTPFLGFQAYQGRFATGKTRFILPMNRGFMRWTDRQQQVFADVLDGVTRETGRDVPSIHRVIEQMAALPAPAPVRLIDLAGLSNTKAAVRDAALRALAHLDAGQGLPALLEAMDDDRSRIAIYALRRALLEMPAEQAVALLRGIKTERVTVAKEVIRLLGELRTETAYRELMSLSARDLHRDSRVALLRGLWAFLDRAEAWDLLEQAAQNPHGTIAAHTARIPAEGLPLWAQDRLIAVMGHLLAHPGATTRVTTLTRLASLPVADRNRILLPLFLHSTQSAVGDEREAAADALFITYTTRDAAQVGEAVRRMLPQRRALTTLVRALLRHLQRDRDPLRDTARAVLAALRADPLTARLRAELAFSALPTEEIVAEIARMADTRELHADALHAAITAISAQSWENRRDVNIATVEAAFAASEDRYVRRLALAALVAQSNGATGWTDDRIARLAAYRRDSAALVAEAAQFTFSPGE